MHKLTLNKWKRNKILHKKAYVQELKDEKQEIVFIHETLQKNLIMKEGKKNFILCK